MRFGFNEENMNAADIVFEYARICMRYLRYVNNGNVTTEQVLFTSNISYEEVFKYVNTPEKLVLIFIQDNHKHLN